MDKLFQGYVYKTLWKKIYIESNNWIKKYWLILLKLVHNKGLKTQWDYLTIFVIHDIKITEYEDLILSASN